MPLAMDARPAGGAGRIRGTSKLTLWVDMVAREIFVDRQQERAEAGSGGQIVMHEWVLWVVINYGVPSSGTSIK